MRKATAGWQRKSWELACRAFIESWKNSKRSDCCSSERTSVVKPLRCDKMNSRFAPLKNDTFLRTLLRQPTEYTPLWLMRQAGRYLPEYNATRKRAGSFLGLAKSPDYATEVTLQPLERYALDAAI